MPKLILSVLVVLALGACAQRPYDALAEMDRAEAAYAAQDLQKAQTHYERLTRFDPSHPGAWFRLGNIYLKQQQLDDAENAYQKAIVLAPAEPRYWQNLVLLQLIQADNLLSLSREHISSRHPGSQELQQMQNDLRRLAVGKP